MFAKAKTALLRIVVDERRSARRRRRRGREARSGRALADRADAAGDGLRQGSRRGATPAAGSRRRGPCSLARRVTTFLGPGKRDDLLSQRVTDFDLIFF